MKKIFYRAKKGTKRIFKGLGTKRIFEITKKMLRNMLKDVTIFWEKGEYGHLRYDIFLDRQVRELYEVRHCQPNITLCEKNFHRS